MAAADEYINVSYNNYEDLLKNIELFNLYTQMETQDFLDNLRSYNEWVQYFEDEELYEGLSEEEEKSIKAKFNLIKLNIETKHGLIKESERRLKIPVYHPVAEEVPYENAAAVVPYENAAAVNYENADVLSAVKKTIKAIIKKLKSGTKTIDIDKNKYFKTYYPKFKKRVSSDTLFLFSIPKINIDETYFKYYFCNVIIRDIKLRIIKTTSTRTGIKKRGTITEDYFNKFIIYLVCLIVFIVEQSLKSDQPIRNIFIDFFIKSEYDSIEKVKNFFKTYCDNEFLNVMFSKLDLTEKTIKLNKMYEKNLMQFKDNVSILTIDSLEPNYYYIQLINEEYILFINDNNSITKYKIIITNDYILEIKSLNISAYNLETLLFYVLKEKIYSFKMLFKNIEQQIINIDIQSLNINYNNPIFNTRRQLHNAASGGGTKKKLNTNNKHKTLKYKNNQGKKLVINKKKSKKKTRMNKKKSKKKHI
jgi:hypothetical protein